MMKAAPSLLALAIASTPLAAAEEPEQAGSPRDAAQVYVERIRSIDDTGPMLNAVIVYQPDAAKMADEVSKAATLLDGRTVLVKDNIETVEWPTTAGSLALKDNLTRRDAPLIERLRAAGGVVLGKTNLSEWANIRSNGSSSGWSAIGGLTRNPHATDRNACGSSSGSGSAVAAGLAWAAIGTETNGSITCPASVNGIVGLKPTVGLVSRTHVIPISHTQDTAGPMTRNVADAALLLNAIAGSDPADAATVDADGNLTDFTQGLSDYSLSGVRIGVLRKQAGSDGRILALFDQALADLRLAGAILVDVEYDPPQGLFGDELHVLLAELRSGMNAYLAGSPADLPVRTLAEVIAFNRANASEEMRWFNQDLFEQAEAIGNREEARSKEWFGKELQGPDRADGEPRTYETALANILRQTREQGLDRLMRENNVTLLVAPTEGPAWATDLVHGDKYSFSVGAGYLPAIAGYPHLTVPMGSLEKLPIGLSFIAGKWQDHLVLKAGAAYERARTAELSAPSFEPWQPDN